MRSWISHLVRLAFFPVGFLFANCATLRGHVGGATPRPLKTDFTRKFDIVYTPEHWPEALQGDLYRPMMKQAAPGVLLLHFGGWRGDDHRRAMSRIARKLASRGYVVFNVTYRKSPHWIYPAQVEDLHQALAWMRRHAAENGMDPDQIATYGYSAGGHLASLVGLMKHPHDEGIKAVVAGGIPADLTFPDTDRMVHDFLGGTKEALPQRYHDASPLSHVNASNPPVFLYHGRRDTLVPSEQVRNFATALEKAGVPHEMHWLNGRGHISAFLFPGRANDEAIDFLDRVFRPVIKGG